MNLGNIGRQPVDIECSHRKRAIAGQHIIQSKPQDKKANTNSLHYITGILAAKLKKKSQKLHGWKVFSSLIIW